MRNGQKNMVLLERNCEATSRKTSFYETYGYERMRYDSMANLEFPAGCLSDGLEMEAFNSIF